MSLQWAGQAPPTAAKAPTDFGEKSAEAGSSAAPTHTRDDNDDQGAASAPKKKAKSVPEGIAKSSDTSVPVAANSSIAPKTTSAPVMESTNKAVDSSKVLTTTPAPAVELANKAVESSKLPTTASTPAVELKIDLPAPVRSGTISQTGFSGRASGAINFSQQATVPHVRNDFIQTFTSSVVGYEQFTSLLRTVSQRCVDAWVLLLGLYLQESGRNPFQLGCVGTHNTWQPDNFRADKLAKNPNQDLGQWVAPAGEPLFNEIAQLINNGGQSAFENYIRSWALTADPQMVNWIVEKAGWRWGLERDLYPEAWRIVDEILKMDPGEAKEQKMGQAKAEAPRFFQACEDDYLFCGV